MCPTDSPRRDFMLKVVRDPNLFISFRRALEDMIHTSTEALNLNARAALLNPEEQSYALMDLGRVKAYQDLLENLNRYYNKEHHD